MEQASTKMAKATAWRGMLKESRVPPNGRGYVLTQLILMGAFWGSGVTMEPPLGNWIGLKKTNDEADVLPAPSVIKGRAVSKDARVPTGAVSTILISGGDLIAEHEAAEESGEVEEGEGGGESDSNAEEAPPKKFSTLLAR